MQTVSNLLLNGNTPVTVGGTGTTAKFFPPQPGPSITNISTKVGYIYPAAGQLASNNQLMHVVAVGNVAPDPTIACPTFLVELVAAINYTAASPTYTVLCGSGTNALGATLGDAVATQPWYTEAILQWDAIGGTVQGRFTYQQDNDIFQNNVKLTNNFINVFPAGTTGSTAAVGTAPFALAVRVTFGTSGAGNSASMYQFALEQ